MSPSLAFGLAVALLASGQASPPPRFADVTAASGVDFRHQNGASAEKFMPETMGAGACLLDADGDGRLDLYLVDGGGFGAGGPTPGPPDRLYRNVSERPGAIRFEDVTPRSGLGDTGYGMGCTAGDADNDGDPDLYVTNFDGNTLWRNQGGMRFTAVAGAGGVAGGRWSTSAAFADLDLDGRLDLYVCNYVDFDPRRNKFCGDLARGLRSYCHPDVYDGVAPYLFLGRGEGLRFEDATRAAGVETAAGKGLGVVLTDVDQDGKVDIYGANDSTIHYLFRNQGKGRFKDESLLSGAGFDGHGRALAGMGVDAGDADGDGDLELFVTNLDLEINTLYRNLGSGRFRDETAAAGLALPSLLKVGFGTAFLDFDQDSDLDLLVVNGHILDNIEQMKDNITYAQTTQLYENIKGDGVYRDLGTDAGEFFARKIVGRGLAVGDLDDDGDPDAVITVNGGQALVLENRAAAGAAVLVDLVGKTSNRDGYGALVSAEVGGKTLVRERKSASSYLSQGDVRLHFGLGGAARLDALNVRWPSGKVDRTGPVAAGSAVVVEEGKGIVRSRRLGEPFPNVQATPAKVPGPGKSKASR